MRSAWKVNWTWVQAPLETDAAGQPAGDQDLRLPLLEEELAGLGQARLLPGAALVGWGSCPPSSAGSLPSPPALVMLRGDSLAEGNA